MSLDDFIKSKRVVVEGTGIAVNVLALFAPCFRDEQAEWLAHILNVHVMETEWAYYQFITVPDTVLNYTNVVMLDTRQPQEHQVVGYAEPAEKQPILQKYLTAE